MEIGNISVVVGLEHSLLTTGQRLPSSPVHLSASSLSSFTMYMAATSVKPEVIISQPTCHTTTAAPQLGNQTHPF